MMDLYLLDNQFYYHYRFIYCSLLKMFLFREIDRWWQELFNTRKIDVISFISYSMIIYLKHHFHEFCNKRIMLIDKKIIWLFLRPQ